MKAVVLNGRVINVGDWDYGIDKSGDVTNPMPAGALVGDFDIVENAKGQLVLADDYRALRAAEYPAIGDQLDALYRAGIFPDDMAALIEAVKAKYPKS